MLDLATIPKDLLVARKADKGNNILTPLCRMTWPNLIVAKVSPIDRDKPDAKKKFSVNLLIPPLADLSALKKQCEAVAVERWGDKVKSVKLKSPFKKAEEYDYEGHLPGWTYLRVTAISKPGVVDRLSGLKITEEDTEVIYGGRWCVASLNAFAFPKAGAPNIGNSGISLGLNNIWLMNHDESIGGRIKPEDEFALAGDGFATAESTTDALF